MKALDRVIVIRRYRGEALVASGTRIVFRRRDPAISVLPANVNCEIRLHLARMRTAGTLPYRRTFCWMCLHRVLLQAALLDERLAAPRFLADMGEMSGVLLHMVEHRVLAILDLAAIRTDKLPLLIPHIRHLRCECHPTRSW